MKSVFYHDYVCSTPAGKRLSHYQQQMEILQEEIYKLESGKDDFRLKYDVLLKDHNDLKEKVTWTVELVLIR
jgi:hypothetical protein